MVLAYDYRTPIPGALEETLMRLSMKTIGLAIATSAFLMAGVADASFAAGNKKGGGGKPQVVQSGNHGGNHRGGNGRALAIGTGVAAAILLGTAAANSGGSGRSYCRRLDHRCDEGSRSACRELRENC